MAGLLFAAVVALVVGGLGFVTHAALDVEQAERLAFARAESGSRERVALWQLDARILPTLAVENNRPFAHYYAFHTPLPLAVDNKGNIAADPARLPSPLLTADFPLWVNLYFQVDESSGWSSPQVLPPGAIDMLDAGLPDQDPTRGEALNYLKAKFPADRAVALLTAGSEAVGDSPLSFPVVVEPKPPVVEQKPGDRTTSAGLGVNPTTGGAGGGRGSAPGRPGGGPGGGGPGEGAGPGAVPPAAPGVPGGGGGFGGQLGSTVPPPAPLPTPQQMPAPASGRGYPPAADPAPATTQAPQAVAGRGGSRMGNEPDSFNQRKELLEKGMKDARGLDNNTTLPSRSAPKSAESLPPPGGPPLQPANKIEQDSKKKAEPEVRAMKEPQGDSTKDATPALGKVELQQQSAKPDTPAYYFRELDGLSVRRGQSNALRFQPPAVHVGPVRPHWLTAPDGTQILVLARPARLESKLVFQGVFLDWDKLNAELKDAVAAEFPEAVLTPAPAPAPVTERTMTALPVMLNPGPAPQPPPAGWTPLRLGLLAAWLAALLALAGVGFAGRALIDLSERRIRFVSAVTHELRTPLTSLRLYLDLLVSGMVREEEKQREYLTTLHGESDRLNRLIENVLDFARLEKRSVQAHKQPVAIDELLNDVRTVWSDRVAADGKELQVISTLPPGQTLTTDGRIAAQVIGNLIDNARKYTRDAADNRIWVWAKPGGRRVVFEVEDRGPGVPQPDRAGLFRPFRRGRDADTTAGGAGLGLALAKQWAEVLGGSLDYRPAEGGVGACFRFSLPA